LQFLGREVALRGLLPENHGFPRETRGFLKATWKSSDVGNRHVSTIQGDATMSLAMLETILLDHDISPVYFAEIKALVFDHVRPSADLIRRLHHTANYIAAFRAILDELSKQVKHRFPPKRDCRKAS
jgi:hypothetical protein